MHRRRPPWLPPKIDEALRPLAEAEAAARNALDRAMVHPTPAAELERLREAWITANDRLANAIQEKQ